jgi:methanogenic corrinoid protein MtbC1
MDLLQKIALCVERGKIDQNSPYPPDMKGQEGADELTRQALDQGISPVDILNGALVEGMKVVGIKFRENRIFVPEVLMAARAMSKAMNHLKPFFQSGEVKRKGTMIIGTVMGDLHDIGKNLVAMMVEGSGWEVVDLGVDVKSHQFTQALDQHPGSVVGLSALLTTTMVNMGPIIKEIKSKSPGTRVMVGGAPMNDEYAKKVGADFYSPDPQGAVEFLNKIA